jgi:hypothetical protein
MTHRIALASLVTAIFASACGGSSSGSGTYSPPAGQTVIVQTAPAETDIAPGESLKFGAQVTGTAETSVTWSVVEPDGGTIDAAGLYMAPAVEGTFHVSAASAFASVPRATSVVRVRRGAKPKPIAVEVTPSTATVPAGGSATFAAAVTGTTANVSVAWSIQEGSCGSVTPAGVYSAPGAAATCHVVATSQADTTKSAVATVTVTAAPVLVVVNVAPASAATTTGGTVSFSATVSGTTAGQSTAVTWSVPAGAGSIGASTGVYVAPTTAGTYVVTATSVAAPTRSATATVTVTAPPPAGVAISMSPLTATLDACKGQVFAATVTNASNTAVTWSVVEAGGGTVTNGIYTAPQAAGTYHVKATSVADPTKTVQGTITVGAEKVVSVAVAPGSGAVQASGALSFAATVTTTCGQFAAQ